MASLFLFFAALTPKGNAIPDEMALHSASTGAGHEEVQETALEDVVEQAEVVVSGSVTGPAGTPVAGLAVELRNSNGDLVNRRYTGSNGLYQVTSHPTGAATGSDVPDFFTLGAIYPNPTGGQSVLPVTISSEDNYRIAIYTVDGRVLMRSEEHFTPGRHQIHISMPRSAGTYLVRVSGRGKSEIRQVTSMSGDGPRLTVIRGPALTSQVLQDDMIQGAIESLVTTEFAWTLRVEGGSAYEDYEAVFLQPGVHEYDITLSYRMDNGIAVCQDLELVESASRPARFVQIEGLNEAFGNEPLAWLYDATIDNPGVDNRNGIFLERLDEDELESEHEGRFIVPLHPGDNMDGGPAKIVITSEDEQIVCPGLEFEVLPLTPAPGTLQQLVNGLDQVFSQHAALWGYDPDELLQASMTELPLHARGTAAGLQAVRGPGFANNLQNLLSGDAPVLEGEILTEQALEVYDAIVAATGLVDLLSEAISGNAKAVAVNNAGDPGGSLHQTGLHTVQAGPHSMQDLIEPDHFVTPEELDRNIRLQQQFTEAHEGLSGAINSAASQTIGVLAFASGVTGPEAITALLGMATLGMAARQIEKDVTRNLLPSRLAGFELQAFPVDYPEDEDSQGAWSASLFAMSQGWTLTWPVLVANFPGLGKAVDILRRFDRMNPTELQEWTLGYLRGYLANIWNVTADSGPLSFDPEAFVVDVDPERENEFHYFTWQLQKLQSEDGSDPFTFDVINEKRYHPKAVGVSELRIRTTGGDVFQGQDAVNTRLLTVHPVTIEIRSVPEDRLPPFYVRSGEELDMKAVVEHANDRSVEWTIYPPADFGISGADQEHLKFYAPDEEGTYLAVASSASRDGLRADNEPPRSATGLIRVTNEQLVITPDPVCVELDDSVPFFASLDGKAIDFSDLQWNITGPGTLQNNGEFIPQGAGQVSIIFTLQSDPEVTSEINFRVSDICSYFVVSSGFFNVESTCVNLIPMIPDHLWHLGVGVDEPFSSIIQMSAIIATEGEWTADLPLPDDDAGMAGDYHWWMPAPIVLDDGTQWDFMPVDMVASTLRLTREERMINGSVVPAYQGSFNLMYYNFSHVVSTGELITTLVSGRFRGVRPGQDGCF